MNDTPAFEITAAQYALENGQLTLAVTDGIAADENDPDFAKYAGAGCPGLESI